MIDFDELFDLLSDYIDQQLESDLCSEIEELMQEDFCCMNLFNTFNKTLELCHEMLEEEIEVPEETHIKLYETLRIEIRRSKEI